MLLSKQAILAYVFLMAAIRPAPVAAAEIDIKNNSPRPIWVAVCYATTNGDLTEERSSAIDGGWIIPAGQSRRVAVGASIPSIWLHINDNGNMVSPPGLETFEIKRSGIVKHFKSAYNKQDWVVGVPGFAGLQTQSNIFYSGDSAQNLDGVQVNALPSSQVFFAKPEGQSIVDAVSKNGRILFFRPKIGASGGTFVY